METWINRNLLCNRYQRNQLLVYNYLTRVWLLFIINRFLEFSVCKVWLPDKQHQQFPRKLARNANSQVWHQITSWTGNAEVGTSNLYFNKSPQTSLVAQIWRWLHWVTKIPRRRAWRPTPVFLPAEFHGQSSLAGYSPWGCKVPDTTEWLTLYTKRILKSGKLWGALFLEIFGCTEQHIGSQIPDQGLNPHLWQWKRQGSPRGALF